MCDFKPLRGFLSSWSSFCLGPNFLFKLEHCDRVEGENFVLKSKNIKLIAVLAPLKPTLDHKLLFYTNFHGHSLCIFF